MKNKLLKSLGFFALLIVLGFTLAGISNGFQNFTGWMSFSIILVIVSLIIKLAWTSVAIERPSEVVLVGVLIAIGFRLILGCVWFSSLPTYGYDSDVNQAGYVMSDAYKRDQAAWILAESENSLFDSFRGFSNTDQYGGLLFFSAFIYRFLGADIHQPLLMVVMTSTISGLAVLYGWAISKRLWNKNIATWTIWLIAFYPELSLMGSSQMREAFTPTFVMIAIYYFIKWWEEKKHIQLLGILLPLGVLLTFSNPTFLFALLMVFAIYLSLSEWSLIKKKWFWIVILIGIILLIAGYFVFTDFVGQWLEASQWEKYLAENSSGWVQRQFRRMPSWSHVPFIVFYGIFRPLLPSALVASGAPIWKAIGIWRALGWTMLLLMLIYSSFLSVRYFKKDKKAFAIILMQWVIIFIASYRGGGDQWDNPRYRAIFAGFQLIMMAWAINTQRKEKDPWMRRAVIAAVVMVIWFIPWYLRRYVELPFMWDLVDIPDAVGVPLMIILLLWLVDWFLVLYQANRSHKK